MEPVEAEPALSAEQIEEWFEAHGIPRYMNCLIRDAALSSLTSRDEGIEAAAKAIDADESGRDSSGYFAELVRALKGASHD